MQIVCSNCGRMNRINVVSRVEVALFALLMLSLICFVILFKFGINALTLAAMVSVYIATFIIFFTSKSPYQCCCEKCRAELKQPRA